MPGKSHEQRSPADYGQWGQKESDVIEHTHTGPQMYPGQRGKSLLPNGGKTKREISANHYNMFWRWEATEGYRREERKRGLCLHENNCNVHISMEIAFYISKILNSLSILSI